MVRTCLVMGGPTLTDTRAAEVRVQIWSQWAINLTKAGQVAARTRPAMSGVRRSPVDAFCPCPLATARAMRCLTSAFGARSRCHAQEGLRRRASPALQQGPA